MNSNDKFFAIFLSITVIMVIMFFSFILYCNKEADLAAIKAGLEQTVRDGALIWVLPDCKEVEK